MDAYKQIHLQKLSTAADYKSVVTKKRNLSGQFPY